MMNELENNLNGPDGREWLAMQFVLGELPEDESAAFDAALTDDAELCELVTQAAYLVASVSMAASKTTPRVDVKPERLAVWLSESQRCVSGVTNDDGRRQMWSVKAALIVTIVMCGLMSLSTKPLSSKSGQPYADLESFQHSHMSDLPLGLDAEDAEDLDGSSAIQDNQSLASLEAPGWLVSAVELEQDNRESGEEDEDAGIL